DYTGVRAEIDRGLGAAVDAADDLLDQIAAVNREITLAEPGVGEAASLRDQRDLLIDQLSQYMEVDVIEHESGSVDVLVNSIPVLLAGNSRGVSLDIKTVDGEVEVRVRVKEDGTHLTVNSGQIGGLLRQRDDSTVGPSITALDDLATQLIHQVNKVHAQGQGLIGFESVKGAYLMNDSSANLNSTDADLPFRTENGSFFIHLTHQDTGQRTSYRIDVDGDAMSADDLINEINVAVGVPNVTASLTFDRAFQLDADAGYEMTFSDDTSGVLSALGINTFFTGEGAADIDVNERLRDNPALLALGGNHVPGSNDTAVAIAGLQDVPVDELGGVSLRSFWQNSVNEMAVKGKAASAAAESASLVRESLGAQIQSVSGVSLDEESINLLMYQRQFQAAARFITVIDEALQILISLA
ncbi:MAG: hypothetical protein KJO43_02275, partial [Phycisphaerae bacterium]|nr:hypothetical protein [Phycisphaerae bacterium]